MFIILWFVRNSFKKLVRFSLLMGKKQLSKSEIVELNSVIERLYGVPSFFDKKDRVVAYEGDIRVVLRDSVPVFFYDGEVIVPTIKSLVGGLFGKVVSVDMGAVKFVAGGADVMRPGIVEFDRSIEKGDIVVVVDQTHKKPLCVARAIMSAKEMDEVKTGKALKSLHHVGDSLWSMDFK